MTEQKFCQSCNQKDNCQDVYRQLGNIKSPSIAFKVVLAFLLPIVVFILSLMAFEKILAGAIDRAELQTALSALLALAVTLVYILIIKVMDTQPGKNKTNK